MFTLCSCQTRLHGSSWRQQGQRVKWTSSLMSQHIMIATLCQRQHFQQTLAFYHSKLSQTEVLVWDCLAPSSLSAVLSFYSLYYWKIQRQNYTQQPERYKKTFFHPFNLVIKFVCLCVCLFFFVFHHHYIDFCHDTYHFDNVSLVSLMDRGNCLCLVTFLHYFAR